MNKNIKKIQDMLRGHYEPKIQVSMTPEEKHTEGDEWEDHRGTRWTIKDGKKKQIFKSDHSLLYNCSDCKKLILKSKDEDTYVRFGRCFYCQIDFECELKEQGMNVWKQWVKEQEEARWKDMEPEIIERIREMKKSTGQAFDKSIANSIANSNIVEQKRKLSK